LLYLKRDGGGSLVDTYTVPKGTTALVWEWNGLITWNEEFSFQIYDSMNN